MSNADEYLRDWLKQNKEKYRNTEGILDKEKLLRDAHKVVADKADKVNAHKAVAHKAVAHKAVAHKAVADKAVADKADKADNADKTVADKPTENQCNGSGETKGGGGQYLQYRPNLDPKIDEEAMIRNLHEAFEIFGHIARKEK